MIRQVAIAALFVVVAVWAVTEVQELGNDDSSNGVATSLDAYDSTLVVNSASEYLLSNCIHYTRTVSPCVKQCNPPFRVTLTPWPVQHGRRSRERTPGCLPLDLWFIHSVLWQ